MRRCVVTGADGFIGRHLCARLEMMGIDVLRITHRAGGGNRLVVDLGSESVPSLADSRPDAVFHLAGRVHRFDAGTEADQMHQAITVGGTNRLLAASVDAHARSFVFFSSCAVMPVGLEQALDESTEPRPTTPYGRAKLQAEDEVLKKNGAGSLRTACLRLPTVYGVGHKGQLARMIRAIEQGVFPPIPELGGARSFIHVDDVVDAAILVADGPQASGKVYIAAEDSAYTSREIYEIVMASLHRTPPAWRVPRSLLAAAARLGDFGEKMTNRQLPFDSDMLRKLSESARFSAGRIKTELGFQPTRTLRHSMPDLISAHTP